MRNARSKTDFVLSETSVSLRYVNPRFVGWEDAEIGDPLCRAPAWMRKGAKKNGIMFDHMGIPNRADCVGF
jgi:hypothetical protein